MRRAIAAGLCLLAAGCFSSRTTLTAPASAGSSKAAPAAFTFTPAGGAPIALAPAACASGEHQEFLGADFADERAGYAVRLVVDPLSGPAVRVYSLARPFDDTVVFRRGDCRVFHFALDSTDWRINHYVDYKVSVELDCGAEGGPAIKGSAAAEHCH